MFLVIDNYDSFVANLARYVEELGEEVIVSRNDRVDLELVKKLKPEGIMISPGPKTPSEAGNSMPIIETFKGIYPILGVCLGHQAIGQVFGARIIHGEKPMHGKISHVWHDGMGIYKGIVSPFSVTRYHSLVLESNSLPNCLEKSCEDESGTVMGIRHKEYIIEGVQFHPEAELTQFGYSLLKNFITICKQCHGDALWKLL